MLAAALKIAVSSGFKTGCTAKIWGWRQNGSIARKITVWPPIERYCFGPPEPARSPRPAATRMAAVRLSFDIGLNYGRFRVDEASVVGWRTALIMLARENRMIPSSCGKSIFCCSALARLQDLSNV